MESLNFVEEIIEEHNRTGRFGGRVHTRFPPEPNGYLHIGHAKSICLNFGLAKRYAGKTNLRFDDTNPATEETEYVESIKNDVRWLGFEWDGEFYASDYFPQIYLWAEQLIGAGLAYVDDQSAEEMSATRGTPTRPGTPSPYRDRTPEENLALFRRMKAGEFAEGSRVLRAKIDLASPNMHLRDPVLYRIKKAHHHRTGDTWCIYPMYDFAHGYSDSIEGITHSICTLEFEVHRPLYDWLIDAVNVYHPQQIEFARLNLTYTVMSKRKLLELVETKAVAGWDDPRLPTLSGLRRRGYTPEAIRAFAEKVGVARRDNVVDMALLEFCIREDLNKRAGRYMAVLNPVKVLITNYPEGQTEHLPAVNNPENPEGGSRELPFGRELYIEQDDFMENPPKGYFRLVPGGEVRLKFAYIIRCDEVVKTPDGQIAELRCTYFPESKSGSDTSGKKVKGTIHWVAASQAVPAEVRLYDRLCTIENLADVPDGEDWKSYLNPESLQKKQAYLEPTLATLPVGTHVQFERLGYFCPDPDSRPGAPVFNRTVTLKDTWAKKN
jgi:glutaminyl-tRNA synthetase